MGEKTSFKFTICVKKSNKQNKIYPQLGFLRLSVGVARVKTDGSSEDNHQTSFCEQSKLNQTIKIKGGGGNSKI